MKTKISYSLLAAAMACGIAQGQTAYTTPVGYVTENLNPGIDNVIGITVHNPTIAAGVITAEAPTKVTTSGVNFSTLLTAGSIYVLELPDGTIQEVASWTDTELNVSEDITAAITPGVTTYVLRKANTISEIFGPTNSAGLKPSVDGGTSAADLILIPNGLGGFITVFYYNDGTDQLWADTDLNPLGDFPVIYTDGLIVRRQPGPLAISLVVAGEVKVDPTKVVVLPGDNVLGSVYPVGVTLANTGFSSQIIPSADGSTAVSDNILMPNGAGGYATFIYYNDGTDALWADPDLNDKNDEPLTSGYIFRSRSIVNESLTQNIPPSYSSL